MQVKNERCGVALLVGMGCLLGGGVASRANDAPPAEAATAPGAVPDAAATEAADLDAAKRAAAAKADAAARVAALIGELADSKTDVDRREEVIGALADAGEEHASVVVPALVACLRDSLLRDPALEALGALGASAPSAVPALAAQLHRGEGIFSRVRAARALAEVGGRTATVALAEALRDPGQPPNVRAEAAAALGRLGGATAVAALAEVLPAARPADVREAVATAIARFARDDLAVGRALNDALRTAEGPRRWRIAVAVLGSGAPEGRAVAALADCLTGGDRRVRRFEVTEALRGAAGDAEPLAAVLVELLGDEDLLVRAGARNALAAVFAERPRAVAALAPAFAFEDARVRREAARLLSAFAAPAGEDASRPLALAFADRDAEVHGLAVDAGARRAALAQVAGR